MQAEGATLAETSLHALHPTACSVALASHEDESTGQQNEDLHPTACSVALARATIVSSVVSATWVARIERVLQTLPCTSLVTETYSQPADSIVKDRRERLPELSGHSATRYAARFFVFATVCLTYKGLSTSLSFEPVSGRPETGSMSRQDASGSPELGVGPRRRVVPAQPTAVALLMCPA